MGSPVVTPNVGPDQINYWSTVPPVKTAVAPSPSEPEYWSSSPPAAPKVAAPAPSAPVRDDPDDDPSRTVQPAAPQQASPAPAAPNLTENPGGEGLYTMQDGSGASVQVPYSKVPVATRQGYQLPGQGQGGQATGEAARYLHDHLFDPNVQLQTQRDADVAGGKMLADPALRIGEGIKDLTPTDAQQRARGATIGLGPNGEPIPDLAHPGAPMTAQETDEARRRNMHGIAQLLAGGGEVGLVIGAPELTELAGLAATGDATAIAALTRVGVSAGVGAGASAGAGKVADKLHLSPEAKELTQQAAFWAGAGLAGRGFKIEPRAGEYGERGFKASVPGASAEGYFRPAYRSPDPATGGYGEGSTLVPADVNARVTVGGKSVGTTPRGPAPESVSVPAATPAQPKELPAPVEGSKPIQTDPPAVPPEVTPDGRAAGMAIASHPDMRPAMEQATGEHQPIGAEDADSGRTVLQPTNHPAVNQALVTSAMPELRAGLEDALKGVEGATVAGDRDKKDPERLAEKINQEGKPAHTVSDYGGLQVSVDSPKAHEEAVAAIKAKYPVVEEQDNFEKGDDDFGYRSHNLQVQLPSGASVEVQVVPKEVLDSNPDQHKDYEAARAARVSGNDAEFEKQAAVAKAKNDAAMAKFEARNKEVSHSSTSNDVKKEVGETKYKFGNTQANIPEDSDAHAALMAAGKKIDPADLNPTSYGGDGGGAEPGPHVTVRYGIQGDDTAAIEKYIRAQAPFEARLGKTSSFPPSDSSDGGAVIKADVESPELHRLNAEIEKHGDFAPSNFPDYKPHATVAYVKPEAVSKYVGMPETEGKTFPVRFIAITDRNGGAREIPLEGGKDVVEANSKRKGGRGESPELAGRGGNNTPKALSPPVKQGEVLPREKTEQDVRADLDALGTRGDVLTDKEADTVEGWAGKHSEVIEAGTRNYVKGSLVQLPDGTTGTVQWSMGGTMRVKTADGGRKDINRKDAVTIRAPEVTAETTTLRAKEIAERTERDGPAIVQRYIEQMTGKDGITTYATDAAKNLFPEFVEDPLRANDDVAPAAHAVMEAAWKTGLAVPVDDRDVVRIATGSPASGKTTALSIPATERVGMLRESILLDYTGAKRLVEQILASGRKPEIVLYFVDAPETTVERMVVRANEIGRIVSLDYMAKAYARVPGVVERLKSEYGQRLTVQTIDNSGSIDEQKVYSDDVGTAVAAVKGRGSVEILEVMRAKLDELYAAGKVTAEQYREITAARAGNAEGSSDEPPGTRADARAATAGGGKETAKEPPGEVLKPEPKREIAKPAEDGGLSRRPLAKKRATVELGEFGTRRGDAAESNIHGHTKDLANEATRYLENERREQGKIDREQMRATLDLRAAANRLFTEHRTAILTDYAKRLDKSRSEVEGGIRSAIFEHPQRMVTEFEKWVSDHPQGLGEKREAFKAARAKAAAAKTAASDTGARIAGIDGNPTSVLTPSAEHKGMYRLVEASDLVPSHDAQTFAANPKYPKKVQERDYASDKASQHRVIAQAQNYNPAYTVNTNPDAVNGPPIITPDGIVLGGNSRAMSTQRAYAAGAGDGYRKALEDRAGDFGLTREQVAGMKRPVLVREIEKPSTQDEMERVGSALNKNMTGALTPSQKAVSAGRKITPETMDELGRLIDSTGETASIRDIMREHGPQALELLRSSGALTEREAQGFRDGAEVSEDGKQFIENAILGNIVDEAKLMDRTPKSILNKLDGVLAAVTNLSAKDDAYDLIAPIRKALEQHADIAARKVNLVDLQNQGGLLKQRDENPVVDAIARKLAEKPSAVKTAFRNFAADAKDARLGQGSMFGGPPAAFDRFNEWFGTKLTHEEYLDGLARSVYEVVRSGEGEGPSEGDGSLQKSRAGEPPSSGTGDADRAGSGRHQPEDEPELNQPASPAYPGGGTKLYSNPFDPELFQKYIGEPLMRMAEPLREELDRRTDIAAVANNVHDTLQRLDRANKAVTLEAKGIARAFEEAGFTKADGDKVFAHLEDPSVKLTSQQEQLRDKWIKPLNQRAALQRRIALLIKSGEFSLDDILGGRVPAADVERIAPEQSNYQHRIPVDKNTFVDKLLGDSMKRFRAPGAALSRAFSSSKRSVFYEITGQDGKREAVAVKNGRVAQFSMVSGRPVVTDLGSYRGGFVDTEAIAKEAAKPLEAKLAALRREYGILTGTKGRIAASAQRISNIEREVASIEKQIAAVYQSVAGKPSGMSNSDALAARLAPIQKVIERLLAQKQGLLPTSDNAKRIARLTERIQENEQLLEDIRDQHEGPKLEGRYWRDKDGGLWKFGRGTTSFITARTGQRYHANAMLSSLVNFMETSKAMNAAVVMERTKGLLEANGMAMQSDNPAHVPEGWKPTTLLQMRGYYFPAHVADAFDQFDYLQSRGQPNMLERVNRFALQTVLLNPAMHIKNVAANWFTGKAAEAITGYSFTPPWYSRNMQAGVQAVNTLRDLGGEEYRRLLRLGLDLQGASTDFDQTTKDILRSFTDALDKDKESNVAMSALLGVGDAVKWLQRMNHLATFGLNDLFVLQSYYAAEAKFRAEGVPDPEEAARDWAHQQVVEYTTPVRVAGSAPVARLLENPNVSAFWRYHFGGIVRPMVNAVKEAAGSFTADDEASAAAGGDERNKYGQSRAAARTNAIGRLAVMTLFATVVFPKLLDRLAKKITGDAQAKAPRGGVLGAASNLAESIEGDRNWSSTIGSVLTPALGTEELAEIGVNRDFFTGKHIAGTNVGFEDKAKQLGAWLVSKSTPGQIMHRFDQSAGRRALYGLLGFTFPLEHGLKEAAEIRNEAEGSNPTDARTTKVWQSILAAAEQARRTGGKDTSVKDALLRSGVLSRGQRRQLILAVHETPVVFAAVDLEHDEDVWRVYEHSTDEEKRELVEDPRTRRRLYKLVKKLGASGEPDKANAIAETLAHAP